MEVQKGHPETQTYQITQPVDLFLTEDSTNHGTSKNIKKSKSTNTKLSCFQHFPASLSVGNETKTPRLNEIVGPGAWLQDAPSPCAAGSYNVIHSTHTNVDGYYGYYGHCIHEA